LKKRSSVRTEIAAAPPPAIARAIVRILLDRDAARRFGENGLKRAQSFSWPKLAERVEAYYGEMVREYPVPRYGRKRH
jgi:glycosyltransferase involved in cell wall biosynthesis